MSDSEGGKKMLCAFLYSICKLLVSTVLPLLTLRNCHKKLLLHISLSHDSSSLASTDTLTDMSSPEHLSRWPFGPFPSPTFAFDIELKLRDRNVEFEKDNKHFQLTRYLKHDILEKLAFTMYGFKAYPRKQGLRLVEMDGRTTDQADVNFLPNFPPGEDPSSLEQLSSVDLGSLTFCFSRIVGKNLKQEFYESTDRHSPCLLEIFRCKRGNVGQLLTQISQQTNVGFAKTSLCHSISCVLRGLPVILGDNPTNFFKAGFESDDDDSYRDLDIGILLIEREGAVLTSSQHLSPALLKIIIEGEVVMGNIQDLPKAMCLLFGLTYALHLNYPKTMKLTFQFIQQVVLSLGHTDLKPKLQTLKNQLAM
uniref:Uncharacterized protein n=1 Tax=Stegastes partitus TaxID=144197 RepID=A0A3B5A6G2_9TELE